MDLDCYPTPFHSFVNVLWTFKINKTILLIFILFFVLLLLSFFLLFI